MKILAERKARIREALQEASWTYKQGDYKTALKLLEPYKSEKRVQFAIDKIQNATKKDSKKKKVLSTKLSEQERESQAKKYSYGFVIFFFVCLFLCPILFSAMANKTPSEILQSLSNSNNVYYTQTDGANVRSCADPNCDKLTVLPVGEAVEIVESVEGVMVGDSTMWYRVILSDEREGFIHSPLLGIVRPTAAPTSIPAPTAYPSSNSSNVSPVQHQWNCRGK